MPKSKQTATGLWGRVDGYNVLQGWWQAYIEPWRWRSGSIAIVLIVLFLLGIFHPTSWQGEISGLFRRTSIYLVNLFLLLLLFLVGLGDRTAYRCALLVPLILFGSTLLSPLPEITLGAYVFFLPISLLFCLNLRDIVWRRLFLYFFVIVNIIFLCLAWAIILDIKQADSFFLNFYNAYLSHMLKTMVVLYNKPVLFFASHAMASFIFTLFCYINYSFFLRSRTWIFLFFSLSYVIIIFHLRSSSAYFSLCLLAGFWIFSVRKLIVRHKFKVLAGLVVVAAGMYLSCAYEQTGVCNALSGIYASIKARLLRPSAGFIGRYSSHGVLAGNIQYIAEHPFLPVGLRNSDQFWFMDSGPVEYLLRGSIFLVAAVYVGLYRFLRFNLPTTAACLILFTFILFNELGFPYLKYFRFMAMFPFLLVCLRYAETDNA